MSLFRFNWSKRRANLLCRTLMLGLAVSANAAERPNILWITVEDMSPQLGCYGDSTVSTPNVDRLASEGVRFTRAFSVSGVSGPSRSALITGMYPTSYGAMHVRVSLTNEVTGRDLLATSAFEAVPPPEVKCFTEYLRAAGYYCSNNSKEDYQFVAPITAWDASGKDAHWRNRPTPETPFFSVLNFSVTHESNVINAVSGQGVTPENVAVPPYYPDTPVVRRDIARNYDNIAKMDQRIGGVLKQLRIDGLLDNTIIFFFSDHGAGLPRAKRWVYDSGIRVPLIVRYPDKKEAGTTNGELVSFVDFAPTILSMLELPVPNYIQGQAFLGSKKKTQRKYIFAFRDRMGAAVERIRAVRDARFEYIRNFRPDLPYVGEIPHRDQMGLMQEINKLNGEGKLGPDQWQFWAKHKPMEELYDTETDPFEIHNIAGDPKHIEKLAELREIQNAFYKLYGDLGELTETELVKKLWPPDGVQPTTVKPVIGVETDGGQATVTLDPQTPGASLAYQINNDGRWQLYRGAIKLKKGERLTARAHRIGFKPSEDVVFPIPQK